MLYKSGEAKLTSGGQATLRKVAGVLNSEFANYPVRVEGHADSDPIRRTRTQYASNWELSAARAGSVIRHFLSRGGIEATRFLAVGMADTLPRKPNDSAVNRVHNRRVEIAFQKPLDSLSNGEEHGTDAWVFDPIFQ